METYTKGQWTVRQGSEDGRFGPTSDIDDKDLSSRVCRSGGDLRKLFETKRPEQEGGYVVIFVHCK